MGQSLSVDQAASAAEHTPSYGLKQHSLSPLETLAQSVSTMAPVTSPTMTIPLVFALAGNGTWLSYVFATAGILLVALCISRFARYSSSPGSLYAYAASAFRSKAGEPRSTWWGLVSAWALLFAYVATGASVTGGFINYSNVLLFSMTGHHVSPSGLAAVAILGATAIAYRDVKVSAQFMLWIEAVSVTMILIVVALLFWKHGFHLDPEQWRLKGVSGSGVRLGVVLALFSFVGFESASSLGSEARDPLKTIPRALIQSAVLAGFFFLISTYTEVLGFHSSPQSFGESPAPMRFLSGQVGVRFLGPLIDVGAVISMFACTLSCITASARVLLLMSHHGLAHQRFSKTHKRNATPGGAVVLIGLLTLLPTVILTSRGVSGSDIYGWMGSLATYGFITVYGQVTFALPFYLKLKQHLTPALLLLSIIGTLAMVLALVGTLYPVPAAPYNWLPYLYLAYLMTGLVWFAASRRIKAARLQGL
ncbi:Amino acid permease [Acidisarcina polymorpha]|uniref:Amino acid permease n=1 Tax=Acidisarcina polymorpha TaxID=2211140 RepID=A0A2Z5FY44_9BACT|nr:APC family permease [Acidisarcina polymorpha]AXC11781.1 Amino acid permease [Acidisarcina polymorpha]